ncbi:MAG: histone deacetylase [Planctomycetes bacterium]|nr:histone deacetylase [Planctomycetota bacterium]
MILYDDPLFLGHDTGRHPECAERLRRIRAHLENAGMWQGWDIRRPRAATESELALVHEEVHIRRVRRVCEVGNGSLDADTPVSAGSLPAALCAVGAAIEGVDRVIEDPASSVFCLVRPPGHHATPGQAMGFCLFNNVAIAARHARMARGVERLAIVDWDVHHGNGTQDAFYRDASVLYISLHRYPFYPGTGRSGETGEGPGKGFTVNVPLPATTSREEYLDVFDQVMTSRLRPFGADVTLISAGFDAYQGDPVGDGGFGLLPEDFGTLTRAVREAARGRVVSVLEGGYSLEGLPLCVEHHLRILDNG